MRIPRIPVAAPSANFNVISAPAQLLPIPNYGQYVHALHLSIHWFVYQMHKYRNGDAEFPSCSCR